MIVITKLYTEERHVCPGDTFNLTIKDGFNCEVLIKETITVVKTIDFIASFRFALDDGTCPGFHLMGVFACKSELPVELQGAVLFENLTKDQRKKFVKSLGVKIDKETKQKKVAVEKSFLGLGFKSKK